MTIVAFIVLLAALFMAVIVNLALESAVKKRVMAVSALGAGCLGILLYGYGFCWVYGFTPLAFLRALFAVCRMFSGVNDLSSIQAAPLFATEAVLILFWLAHFLGFYVTAGAAISVIGGKLLNRLRVLRLRRGPLVIIFGVNAQSLVYGRRQAAQRRAVLFVDDSCDSTMESAIHRAGAVFESAADALSPTAGFLRRVGMASDKRSMEVAVLDADGVRNLAFARQLLSAGEKLGLESRQMTLLLRGVEEEAAASLTAQGENSGFGSVWAFNDYTLSARLLMRLLPPWETLTFGEDGRAQEDFHGVLVGFGRMGRAVMEQWVMNGQFEGSSFRLDVFDPRPQSGPVFGHPILEAYDVRFHEADAASMAFYRFLNENLARIRCLCFCTGNEALNSEIAQDVRAWLGSRGINIPMCACTPTGVWSLKEMAAEPRHESLYASAVLDLNKMDARAMAINQAYCAANGKTAEENWRDCDAFSRMSSRASGDFYPAMLRAAGRTREQIAQGQWPPVPPVLENLARTEHRRWCAFHTVMGFRPMTDEAFKARAARYLNEVKEKGASALRIGKDLQNRAHACLVDWEALDELSRRENAVTGGQVDYKQMDRNNVLALPGILGDDGRQGGQR